ncbi:MAG TPA: response regulator [Dongiaceae bacterium]|jgi:DNA-binding response OmpR family regulator|nr:response regulator [Dongiaceae bacterium]
MTSETSPESGTKAKITVMVVEPDILIRIAVADYLRHCGFAVIEARAAEEVLAVLDSGRPVEIVFAEVALPGMTGFDLAKTLRARDPSIGVILTSGAESASEKAGDLCEGGPLPKPYKHEEVLRRIRRLREGRR